ncbi:MAG: DUF5615 family PIN-like protein [Candidatus Accumulibacter sp.]|uniref:DUF5615 family PIN-like protein n=1 Tax=Accumulibacter sp. TaxID=2053492 RepID=UPI0025830160|nr:DUF5615 family PIN-like protein [Accumulibacter sp.]MCM8621022.1 DUF5615 family PIN-like protein [Accumulibacter sp.]
MKFLLDAQLPRRFCVWLQEAGHNALHTLDLPLGNRTSDNAILQFAEQPQRVVVTKDTDFVQSFMVTGKPRQLLLVATGNIGNNELENLMKTNLPAITQALEIGRFVEISRNALTIHE